MTKYNNDATFALQARCIFVPEECLEEAFQELSNSTPLDLISILNWFEDTYLGRSNNLNGRQPALFPYNVWTVYQRTIDGEARTNNYAEASHRRLQAEFGMDHLHSENLLMALGKYN